DGGAEFGVAGARHLSRLPPVLRQVNPSSASFPQSVRPRYLCAACLSTAINTRDGRFFTSHHPINNPTIGQSSMATTVGSRCRARSQSATRATSGSAKKRGQRMVVHALPLALRLREVVSHIAKLFRALRKPVLPSVPLRQA